MTAIFALLLGAAAQAGASPLLTLLRMDREAPVRYPSDVAERFCLVALAALLALYLAGAAAHRLARCRGTIPAFHGRQGAIAAVLLALLFFFSWETAVRLYAAALGPTTFQPDAHLLWTMKPNLRGSIHMVASGPMVIDTNSQGLREREIPLAKEAGELRILFIGDSWTWGHGVAEEETFVRVLEAELARRLPGRVVRAINAGVPGFTVVQGYELLRKLLPLYKPDLVVVGGFNRFSTRQIGRLRNAAAPESPRGALQALLQQSAVYMCIRKTVSRFAAPPSPGDGASPATDARAVKEIQAITKELFEKVDREVADHGIPCIFFDHLNSLKPSPSFEIALEPRVSSPPFEYVLSPRRPSRKAMDRDAVYNVELHTPLRGAQAFWIENDATQHPGPAGHRAIAGTLLDAIIALGLTRSPARSVTP